ncbi:MAG: MFS transporter [Pseudomonadota bacterium]
MNQTAADAAPHPYRWAVLFGVWLMYFSFGLSIASTGPLVAEIQADLDVSRATMGAVLGAWQLTYIAAALPLGAALDRTGVALGLMGSAIVMSASLFLRGAAGDDVTLFIAVAVFGLGGPLVSVGAPKLIALWFTGASRGMAMGVYMTGPALGGIVAFSTANAVLVPLTGSWRGAMYLLGGAVLACGVVWWLISRHPEARARDGKVGGMSKAESLRAFAEIASLRTVQIVLLMAIGIFIINHGLNNWLPEILRAKGMTAVEAGYWASIPTLVGVIGALTIPRFATPERRVPIMLALFILALVATLLLQLLPGTGLVAGLMMQGIARSSMMTVAILLLMEAPGVPPERAGMAGGMFFTVAEVGGVLGPLSIGVVSDASGGFEAPLWMLTGVAVVLLGLLGWLRLLQVRTAPAA